MPIYEFLCRDCNRIFSFHSFRVDTSKIPTCPKCGASDLRRLPSAFGIGEATRTREADAGAGEDFDDPKVEAELMRFAAEMEHMDENDPKAMARMMRRMTDIAGETVTPAMEEMMRRLAAGEDPERIEEDLGDALSEEMDGEGGGHHHGAPERDGGLYPL